MSAGQLIEIAVIGLVVGFLGGMFGKGGSAIATPMLQLVGVAPFAAVASPLPATIPSTLVASLAYLRSGLYDKRVVTWTVVAGVPMTILGALLSSSVGGVALLLLSNVVVAGLGASFLVAPTAHREDEGTPRAGSTSSTGAAIAVGALVGFVSGLLANSGGFLFAPLYVRVLKLPLKAAFACSLVASAAIALPGTAVHVLLGHVDWRIVGAFALGSIPFAYLGAKVSIALKAERIELIFGVALVLIGLLGAADSLGYSPGMLLRR